MKRSVRGAGFVVAILGGLALGGPARAAGEPSAVPPEASGPVDLGGGVHALPADPIPGGPLAAGWIPFEEFVVVVDPGDVARGRTVAEAIRGGTDRAIRFAVWTGERPGETSLGGTSIGCRQATLKLVDRLKIGDGSQRIEILHFGPGRTEADAVVFVPREKVLFTGLLCTNGASLTEDEWASADTEGWAEILATLRGLGAETIVPGRGATGGPDLLEKQERALREVRAAVAHGIAAGRDAATIAAGVEAPAFAAWAGRPAREFPAAVRRVFDEMTGRAPPRYLTEDLELREGPSPTRATPGWTPPKKVVVYGAPEDAARLRHVAPGVEIVAVRDPEAVASAAVDADAVIGFCSADVVRSGKKLRWIQVGSAGVERYVAIPELVASDVVLTNAQRLYGPEMAEHVFGMVLALTRGLAYTLPRQPTGEWLRSDLGRAVDFVELRGKTMLVVGLGGIGTEVARRADAFGMTVLATRRRVSERPPFVRRIGPPESTRDLAREADVVVNCTPLTAETRGMFDAAFFEGMRPTAIFVNVGRGGSVVTDDLVAALREKKLAGACLDVTDPEPLPEDHPLWKMPNVVITPHVSARSDFAGSRILDLYRENLRRFTAGEALLSVVNKGQGY